MDTNVIEFGTAVIDETMTQNIVLTNSGARPAKFTFQMVPCELPLEV